jgi:nucleotide-binding universal stress UspA family protein
MALAERFGAELHVMHVIAPIPAPMPDTNMSWFPQEPDLSFQVEESKKTLRKEIGDNWAAKHQVVLYVEIGFAVDEIVDYARKHDVDLIVCGTHGHTGFSHLLLGSVAEKLVRVANCPVLTVHPTGHQFVDEMSTATESKAVLA